MAESATPTSISTITATIIPDASARASDSIIRRPIPCSAPMNSPTMTPISANEIAGESEANTQAIVEGLLATVILFTAAGIAAPLFIIMVVFVLIPWMLWGFSITTERLHDSDKTTWWLLLFYWLPAD